ncbi:putative Amino acid adenylation domain-containing protein [Seiridium cardinale]
MMPPETISTGSLGDPAVERYWHRRLAQLQSSVIKPDLTKAAECSNRGRVELSLEAEVLSRLEQYREETEVIPFHIFLAAWALNVSLYSSSSSPTIGYSFQHEFSGTQLFAVLNMRIRSSNTLDHLVTTAATECERDEAYAGASLQYLSKPQRSLFNSIFVDGFPVTDDQWIHLDSDIVLQVREGRIHLDYNASKFSHWYATSLVHSWLTCLLNIINHSESEIGNVELISDRDRTQIRAWNGPVTKPFWVCIHQLIEISARRAPHSLAFDAWDGKLTYLELMNLTSTLAQHLKSLGVGPDRIVPVCFEKSLWAAVAMIAVLKAGGACANIDPEHPPARLDSILAQAGAQWILVSPTTSHVFVGKVANLVVVNRENLQELPPSPSHYCCPEVEPSHAAFVVFTSGTTGMPKGIVQSHAAFCTSVLEHGRVLSSGKHSRVLQFSAYTFDASLSDVFTTLTNGGCICVPCEADRLDRVADVINNMQVNQACLTPTTVRLLQPSEVPGLRVLSLTGEPLTQENIATWADRVRLINVYGPAECTIWCTRNADINSATDARNIGYAVGCHCWIADPQTHKLLPIGATGELVVEGPILARGYLNNDAQTRTVFLDDVEWANGRVYCTGDLVRYRPDGSIYYVGRKDSQVKHHGQRIEMGEIEHVLGSLPFIKHCVILRPESGPLDGRITAVLSLHETESASTRRTSEITSVDVLDHGELQRIKPWLSKAREQLRAKLPLYMIPTAWLVVRDIPLLSSGKLAKPQVRDWVDTLDGPTCVDALRLWAEDGPDQPASELEKKLQGIWAKVLGIPDAEVGLGTAFLDLGGDSFKAMQLVSTCKSAGLAVGSKDVLRNHTIQELAKSLDLRV